MNDVNAASATPPAIALAAILGGIDRCNAISKTVSASMYGQPRALLPCKRSCVRPTLCIVSDKLPGAKAIVNTQDGYCQLPDCSIFESVHIIAITNCLLTWTAAYSIVVKSTISSDRETTQVFLRNLANQCRCGKLLLSIK